MIYRLLYRLLYDSPDVRDRVGTRIYPERAPASVVRPFIVLRFAGSTVNAHLSNETGLAERLMQIDYFDDTASGAESGMERVRLLLSGYSGDVDVLDDLGDEQTLSVVVNLDDVGLIPYAPQDGSDKWIYRASTEAQVFHSQDVPTHV